MKLMKRIMIALVLWAIPAMTFAQTVVCKDCTHDVSIYMGDGGFIAEADGVDKVTWVADCPGVIHQGELEPDEDGVVMLQFADRGIVCDAEGGHLQLGPVKDGGWFWITGDRNSAVGSLVDQNRLDNPPTDILSAGPGVKMTLGRGAVLLEETSTGRLGILSAILLEPPTSFRKCGYNDKGPGASPRYTRRFSECTTGDGNTLTLATVTDGFTGETVQIQNGGAVARPGGTDTLTLIVDLWMNGSGHFTTAVDGSPTLGHPEFAATPTGRAANRLTNVSYSVEVGSGMTKQVLSAGGAAAGGVSFALANHTAEIYIVKDDVYCSTTANYTLPVIVRPEMDTLAGYEAQVTPPIELLPGEGEGEGDGEGDGGGSFGDVGEALSFTVTCP